MAVREAYVSASGGGGVGQPSYNPNTVNRTALAALSGLVQGVVNPSPREKMMADLLPTLLNAGAVGPSTTGAKPDFSVGGLPFSMDPNYKDDQLTKAMASNLSAIGAVRPAQPGQESTFSAFGMPMTIDYGAYDATRQAAIDTARAKLIKAVSDANPGLNSAEIAAKAEEIWSDPVMQKLLTSGQFDMSQKIGNTTLRFGNLGMADYQLKRLGDMQPKPTQYQMPGKTATPTRPNIKMPSEADIQFTMKKRGMTRDQVLKALGM